MQTPRGSRILALGAAIVLLALSTASCARRGQAVDGGSTPAPFATVAADAATPAVSADLAASPGPTAIAPATSPVPTPDLAAIDALINDIDTDLNADASAGPNEGSTP
jgi:hypothetical protein